MSDIVGKVYDAEIMPDHSTDLVKQSRSLAKTTPLSQVSLKFVSSVDDCQELLRWLSEDRNRPVLAYDLETGGLRRHADPRRLAQFGDPQTGWAIRTDRWDGLAEEVIGKWEGQWVGHNISFDSAFTERDYGIRWPWNRTHDTMLMSHVLDPSISKALKSLTSRLIDRTAAAGQDALTKFMRDNNFNWNTIPVDNPYYWGYGAMDTVLTARLYDKLYPQLEAMPEWREMYELEMAVSRVCASMEKHGARVDLEYSRGKARNLREYAAKWRAEAKERFGVENPGSPLQLRNYFVDQGLEPEKTTPKGDLAMDKEVLESIDHPLAGLVLKIRKADKLAGSYLENFDEMADSEGYVHPTIWTCGTKTARMSITDPALQTLPKDDKVVRNAFIPSDGCRLISIDADQIELRLLSHYAQDAGLQAVFESGEDFFCRVASEALGEPVGKEDPRRKLFKSSVYARVYGAGPEKIAKTAHVPVETIRSTNRAFDAAYPGVQAFMDRMTNEVAQRAIEEGTGYVIAYGGRRIPTEPGKNYVGCNYRLQSSAAIVLKKVIVELDSAGFGDFLRLPVHDELILDVLAAEANDALIEASKVMEAATTGDFAVPLTWSGDVMPYAWGGRELEAV